MNTTMNVKELSNIELARQFACNYAACNDHDAEREELERRGLSHVAISSACIYLSERYADKMTEDEYDEAIENAAKELADALDSVHAVYEVWIVDNGSMRDFRRGIEPRPTATANLCWGAYDTLDEVRERFRELADENYNRECGPCESADDLAECAKYVDDCVRALRIEWHDDLKYVCVRKLLEDNVGERKFVEVL